MTSFPITESDELSTTTTSALIEEYHWDGADQMNSEEANEYK